MLRKASMEKFHSYLEYNNMTKNKHQEDGIYWCIEHELDQTDDLLKGGIIADEMGLGKTILMSSENIIILFKIFSILFNLSTFEGL